ncbi:uncharacterized protein N7503_006352 [Penicillium pulvis]|uniref:uncharacterized protein n=1 Tax=Penicillium pulvis TaxID=1562058 RepID=UPI002547542A|nr:uncharacterized protein N7503_006352 [Penicillium pulvis]KAJ5798847.1 hypothetical protein N7503_006352 [Penicillium pulvis]
MKSDICATCGEIRTVEGARFEHVRIGLDEPPELVLSPTSCSTARSYANPGTSSRSMTGEIFRLVHDDQAHQGFDACWQKLNGITFYKGAKLLKQYITHCPVCLENKTRRHKPYGSPQPILSPPVPFHTLTLDWVVGLPTTAEGYDCALVMVCKFTKLSAALPGQTDWTGQQWAKLALAYWMSANWGIPSVMTSALPFLQLDSIRSVIPVINAVLLDLVRSDIPVINAVLSPSVEATLLRSTMPILNNDVVLLIEDHLCYQPDKFSMMCVCRQWYALLLPRLFARRIWMNSNIGAAFRNLDVRLDLDYGVPEPKYDVRIVKEAVERACDSHERAAEGIAVDLDDSLVASGSGLEYEATLELILVHAQGSAQVQAHTHDYDLGL